MHNLFTNVPSHLDQELVETILRSRFLRIERIVSTGQASAPGFWYDQKDHEWVVVLQGRARLRFDDGQTKDLNAGDFVHIKAHQRHRVESTSSEEATVWLAVFYSASANAEPAASENKPDHS